MLILSLLVGLTSLQNCSIHPVLSVFIAWVNLDFGVETCFYPGMDTYQKVWLQLAFPLYIWSMVVIVILASHYSSTAVKVFGSNNVAILATLFLLSYTKILTTIITAINFTEVLEGQADNVSIQLVSYKVWTYDGNIKYLNGKHTPMFVVAVLLFAFLFIPYTLSLTFGQCLRSLRTGNRFVLRCLHSTVFISIMDTYHSPYNKKYRYWTGLLLLTRCVLFLAFISASHGRNKLLSNMFITTIILIAVLTLKIFIQKIYINTFLNFIEVCFFLNLVVLSTTLHYLTSNSNDDNICKIITSSVSLAMIMFIGIVIYHAYLIITKTNLFKTLKTIIITKMPLKKNSRANQLEREIQLCAKEQ